MHPSVITVWYSSQISCMASAFCWVMLWTILFLKYKLTEHFFAKVVRLLFEVSFLCCSPDTFRPRCRYINNRWQRCTTSDSAKALIWKTISLLLTGNLQLRNALTMSCICVLALRPTTSMPRYERPTAARWLPESLDVRGYFNIWQTCQEQLTSQAFVTPSINCWLRLPPVSAITAMH